MRVTAAAAAKSLQSCPTLCDARDGSPPGCPIPGILQARTLEWVAISFSSAWNWKVKVKSFSHVWLCATPQMAAHQAVPSLGFSRQEHWSGLPFPSPVHETEKWKWSRSVVSDPQRPHGLQSTRLLRPWGFPGKSTGVGCHRLLCNGYIVVYYSFFFVDPFTLCAVLMGRFLWPFDRWRYLCIKILLKRNLLFVLPNDTA